MQVAKVLAHLGQPVAFYPQLRVIMQNGSTRFAPISTVILLCQLLYWCGKEKFPDKGIYKTADQLQEETGLSYEEQLTARKHLTNLGILTINRVHTRSEHKLYFKIDVERLEELWSACSLT